MDDGGGRPIVVEEVDSQLACAVCGDPSAARHYGSNCCNGCKGFFRRSVREKRTYQCSSNNACLIDRAYRNCCRACRLRKCFAAGLDPRLVHGDRKVDPKLGGMSALKREAEDDGEWGQEQPPSKQEKWETEEKWALPDNNTIATRTGYQSTNPSHKWDYTGGKISSPFHQGSLMASATARESEQQVLIASNRMALEVCSARPLGARSRLLRDFLSAASHVSASRYFVQVERFCDSIVEVAESHTLPTGANSSIKFNLNLRMEQAFQEPGAIIRRNGAKYRRFSRTAMNWSAGHYLQANLFHMEWCRMVANVIDWASHVPELGQLDLEDAVKMVSSRITICGLFTFVQKSIRHSNREVMLLSGGSYFPMDVQEQSRTDPALLNFLRAISNSMYEIVSAGRALCVSDEELALLKILIFCTPAPTMSPAGKELISMAQARYQAALAEEVMKGVAPHEPQQPDNRTISLSSRLDPFLRLSIMMSWLSAMERVTNECENHLSIMALFNEQMTRGTLPYELHVRGANC